MSLEVITPAIVAQDYHIPENTQAVWRSQNRYGFRKLALKVGRRIAYRRSDIESWLETRRTSKLDEQNS